MERRGRRGRRGRGVPQKPQFVPLSSLEPGGTNVNVHVKAMEQPKLIMEKQRLDGSTAKQWEVLVGDSSGCMNLRIPKEEVVEMIQEGTSLTVRNGFIEMVNEKFMRLATNIWGKLEVAPSAHEFSANSSVNFSQQEYELEK